MVWRRGFVVWDGRRMALVGAAGGEVGWSFEHGIPVEERSAKGGSPIFVLVVGGTGENRIGGVGLSLGRARP